VSETSDIRRWARAHNISVPDKGPIRDEVREMWARRHDDDGQAAELAADETGALPGDEDSSSWEGEPFIVTMPNGAHTGAAAPAAEALRAPQSAPPAGAGQSPARPAERKPVPPPREGRGLFRRKARAASPRPVRRRVSIENIVSGGWGLAAVAFLRKPEMVPVGRVLQMQAPVAGIIVEDAAKGTVVDRILQPFARAGESGEKALALAGPPLLVFVMTSQPQLYPMLRPVLKAAMLSWLEISEPAMKKAQKRAERLAEQYGEVDLDAMIDAIWAPADGAAAPSEDEEAAIRRAKGST
jgi:hypothetical protein